MGLELVAGPDTEPVSVDELRVQCRINDAGGDEEQYLESLGIAARRRAESFCRRAFITQTWRLTRPCFPGGGLRGSWRWGAEVDRAAAADLKLWLPMPPLQNVTEVQYYDTAGNLQTLDAALYRKNLHGIQGSISPAIGRSWPDTHAEIDEAVIVTFVAGYGDEDESVPEEIRHAIRLQVADWFAQRETFVVGTVTGEVSSLALENQLRPYQLITFGG
jgi:uncharacterized phiE125 gp8 family phage protein